MKQYFFRQNESKYGGQLVGGIIHEGCEVQQWTWYAHTTPDSIRNTSRPLEPVIFDDWSDYKIERKVHDDSIRWSDPTV